jgi:tRNA-specific 2-thiouridylase
MLVTESILSKYAKTSQGPVNYLPDPRKSRIAVAMSGGVDSSVAAYLLKEAGYEVVGITAWLIAGTGRCCDTGMVDAVRICDQIGIEHHSVDLREAFASGIIKDFHQSYARGETPIPCISCNNDMKWGHLLDYSLRVLGATHLASGHYGRVVVKDDEFLLYKSAHDKKDQSYMLWGLNQKQLSHTLFPIADMAKDAVREIARSAELSVANKPDSQDICFVSVGMTNSDYLTRILGEKPGDIVMVSDGRVLGSHKGSFNYTYGQRKGIGIAHTEPLYVVKIDPDLNTVYVGTKGDLLSQRAIGKDANYIGDAEMLVDDLGLEYFKARVKIRYNSSPVAAKVYPETGARVSVEFEDTVEAITPGQAMAFYGDGDRVIGGAWIE